jgi:hypothetical protein
MVGALYCSKEVTHMTRTNADALSFEEWAEPALDRGVPRWKVRRLAVEATHLDADTKAIS